MMYLASLDLFTPLLLTDNSRTVSGREPVTGQETDWAVRNVA